MRKQDYSALARILKAQLTADVSREGDAHVWAVQAGNTRATNAIIAACAKALNVDAAEFTAACSLAVPPRCSPPA